MNIDAAEQEKTRRRQILQLARYGRMGGLHAWDDEPVTEMRAWWSELKEMLDEENAVATHAENR